METPYQPINCDYYDRLEAWATQRTRVTIEYLSGAAPATIEGVIVDLFVKEKVEWLRLENGATLRLDQLIAVNHIPLPNHC